MMILVKEGTYFVHYCVIHSIDVQNSLIGPLKRVTKRWKKQLTRNLFKHSRSEVRD